jgi:hypothetical protein
MAIDGNNGLRWIWRNFFEANFMWGTESPKSAATYLEVLNFIKSKELCAIC